MPHPKKGVVSYWSDMSVHRCCSLQSMWMAYQINTQKKKKTNNFIQFQWIQNFNKTWVHIFRNKTWIQIHKHLPTTNFWSVLLGHRGSAPGGAAVPKGQGGASDLLDTLAAAAARLQRLGGDITWELWEIWFRTYFLDFFLIQSFEKLWDFEKQNLNGNFVLLERCEDFGS